MKYVQHVRVRLGPVVVVVAGLLSTACWGGAGRTDPPGPTVPTEAPATSPTSVPDVATVPAVIDEAYLNEVLRVLNRVDGDAMRLIVQEEDLVPPAVERLAAIYHEDEFNNQLQAWGRQLQEGLETFKSPPGDKINSVVRIVTDRRDCIYMETMEDYRPVSTAAQAPITMFVALQPKAAAADEQDFNSTAWMISFVGASPEGTDPGLSPCAR